MSWNRQSRPTHGQLLSGGGGLLTTLISMSVETPVEMEITVENINKQICVAMMMSLLCLTAK